MVSSSTITTNYANTLTNYDISDENNPIVEVCYRCRVKDGIDDCYSCFKGAENNKEPRYVFGVSKNDVSTLCAKVRDQVSEGLERYIGVYFYRPAYFVNKNDEIYYECSFCKKETITQRTYKKNGFFENEDNPACRNCMIEVFQALGSGRDELFESSYHHPVMNQPDKDGTTTIYLSDIKYPLLKDIQEDILFKDYKILVCEDCNGFQGEQCIPRCQDCFDINIFSNRNIAAMKKMNDDVTELYIMTLIALASYFGYYKTAGVHYDVLMRIYSKFRLKNPIHNEPKKRKRRRKAKK